MLNATRTAFNAYLERQAQLNGVSDATKKFAVESSIEQTLETKIREKADFLKDINIVPVSQQSGQKLGLGVSGPVASRTNTASKDRIPRDIHTLDQRGYKAEQTNFDTAIRYQTLDHWARFPDFQTRLRDEVTEQIARDRLMIGWNGETAAVETDLVANPLLQDVNVGWLTHIRTDAPARVMTGVKIGDQAGADYKNFDAAVFDMSEMLDEWHRESPDLIAIVGGSLLGDKILSLVNAANAPTENQAMQTLILNKTMGGRRAVKVPYFPAKSILLTAASNLSIYWQEGTRRRQIKENSARDRIEDFQSVNEAYVVEVLGKCALIDGVLQPDGAGGWA